MRTRDANRGCEPGTRATHPDHAFGSRVRIPTVRRAASVRPV
ncbi:conserved hypothetical protein [Burkholderia pseudomallei 668]|nr:conserved hypothetical protein [Burkholderia pseudomallei 668]